MLPTDVRQHYRFSPEAVELVTIHDAPGRVVRLACFEPRQTLHADAIGQSPAAIYVLEGTAIFARTEDQGGPAYVSAGGLVCTDPGEIFPINNPGPARLVLMIVV